MKTHILQLEPHDDVFSVRDKMGWGQAARVLLVGGPNAFILGLREAWQSGRQTMDDGRWTRSVRGCVPSGRALFWAFHRA